MTIYGSGIEYPGAGPWNPPALHGKAATHIRFVTHPGPDDAPGICVERYFPAPHHIDERIRSAAEAEMLLGQAAVHFEMLGIRTPEVYENAIVPTDNGYRIESRVEFVPHRPLVTQNTDSGIWRIQPEDSDVFEEVFDKILGYHQKVRSAHKPYFLSDVTRIEQYGVTPDGEPVLPDNDPLMKRATDYGLGQSLASLLLPLSVLPEQQTQLDYIRKILTSGVPFVL